ncbi:hypothetical protein P3X46_017116 [Hevea brasiliensis]|uniref:NAC domain-containing protein n=1 Tax=Hevea brasiliensis TaxID=3981 RepID=A0ABQ9M182_HEVBR|nr:NAC domain-containing protein 92-like [Hevea brasiliensis]KAJ9174044.1 hypothetical protein P3X46_017116 [Hevea brasiliensis]
MEENLPPGFRFHPTDAELITFYLTRKVSDVSFTSKAIVDVDLNKCEPWDLPGKASMGEKEWYFFSLRDRKYPTGLRTNRATEAGYWKTTGKDKEIFRGAELVGMKKTLVFYKGRAPRGEKSNWVVHEYRLESKHPCKPTKEEWVVCRVFQKSSAAAKKPQQTASSQQSLGSPCDTNSIVNEFGDIELPNLNNIVNSSNGFNNIPTQSSYNNETNVNMSMNIHNWAATREQSSLSWPSSLLSSNLSMNSLLLKALQMRSYQQREASAAACSSDHHSFLTQVSTPQFGTDLCSNFQGSSSSSKVLETVQQPVQQEQPFNLDSIW